MCTVCQTGCGRHTARDSMLRQINRRTCTPKKHTHTEAAGAYSGVVHRGRGCVQWSRAERAMVHDRTRTIQIPQRAHHTRWWEWWGNTCPCSDSLFASEDKLPLLRWIKELHGWLVHVVGYSKCIAVCSSINHLGTPPDKVGDGRGITIPDGVPAHTLVVLLGQAVVTRDIPIAIAPDRLNRHQSQQHSQYVMVLYGRTHLGSETRTRPTCGSAV